MKRLSFIAALALAATAWPAAIQAAEIRLAKQFSMGYLQFNAMETHKLIEKHAEALGLKDTKVSWLKFNGPAAINDALLSGTVDVGAGGTPGLLVLWAKTKGTPQEVRGVSAMSAQPFLMNSREARIKTIADLKDSDRIALPSVKVSIQAIALQMAAAKMFGPANFAKYDTLTVSMPPPDATIAMLSGASEINNVFSVPPFQQQQLEKPGIHTVLNSYDIMDGPATFTVAWTSKRFRDDNPVLYKALLAAMTEATDIINKDKRAAGQLWIDDANSKLGSDFVEKIVAGPQVKWTLVPENTMKFARFMATTGMIKAQPDSWMDYFFPEIHSMSGS